MSVFRGVHGTGRGFNSINIYLAGLGRHHNLDHVVDGDGFSDDIFTKRLAVSQSNKTEEIL